MDLCSRKIFSEILIGLVVFIFTGVLVLARSPDDLNPRVPPEHLEEAKSFQNPFRTSGDIVATGKKLYESKAFCSSCHGLEGAGGASDGLTLYGEQLPTNLADAAWQAARTDGGNFLDSYARQSWHGHSSFHAAVLN